MLNSGPDQVISVGPESMRQSSDGCSVAMKQCPPAPQSCTEIPTRTNGPSIEHLCGQQGGRSCPTTLTHCTPRAQWPARHCELIDSTQTMDRFLWACRRVSAELELIGRAIRQDVGELTVDAGRGRTTPVLPNTRLSACSCTRSIARSSPLPPRLPLAGKPCSMRVGGPCARVEAVTRAQST
jgi:hypothetical protein